MRGQKGITLVALIITIIVLLILAVVTIGAVKGSRIIDHAQNAATSYNSAKAAEEATIVDSENVLDQIVENINK